MTSSPGEPTECVGEPPRQTEDPLSPPCRGTGFDGDNGGKTWSGVTRDEVRVVLYNDLGVDGDMDEGWSLSDEDPDDLVFPDSRFLVRTIKTQLRYFESRFQTWGRDVRVFAVSSTGPSCNQRRGDAGGTLIDHSPFATVIVGADAECYVRELAREYKIMSFGSMLEVPRAVYGDSDPYVWSFFPDRKTAAGLSAGFICRKLVGRPARLAGSSSLHQETRKLALLVPEADPVGEPPLAQLGESLVERLASRCGAQFDTVIPYDAQGIAGTGPLAGSPEVITMMQRLKIQGITTIACYCSPTSHVIGAMQDAAAQNDFFPEWYWDHATGMDRPSRQRTYARSSHVSFGSSYLWRVGSLDSQHHYRAYRAVDPGTTPNERWSWEIYHAFLNLFSAIQEATPLLTPAGVEAGLSALSFRDTQFPFAPSGGYEPASVSHHTFVDTATGWWWDPSGTEPGGSLLEPGCVRLAREGRRSYASSWPEGDGDLFVDGAPCTGPAHTTFP